MDYADGHRERGFLAPYRRDEELRSSMVDSQGRSADPVQHSLRSSGNDTRRILLDAGLAMLEERGYAASRLADVAAAAGLTTGAFYRHFPSKLDFFHVLSEEYSESLTGALSASSSLTDALQEWLLVARKYRGVIRAAAEMMRPGTAEAAIYRELRRSCTYLLEPHLRSAGAGGKAEALMVVDTVDQYAVMEACGWIPERPVAEIAATLNQLVTTGLYQA
jgi:AcrR family transcriptional regulator